MAQAKVFSSGLFSATVRNDHQYFCIPAVDNPRIIIPFKNKLLFQQGLNIHNTSSFKNRILKTLISSSFILCKIFKRNILYGGFELKNFIKFLNQYNGYGKIEEVAVYCGTKGSINRKFTFLLLDSYGTNLGIIKYPHTKISVNFIKNEYNQLQSLKDNNFNCLKYPSASKLITWRDKSLLYQENIFNDASQINCDLNINIVDAAIELAKSPINSEGDINYFTKYNNLFSEYKIDLTMVDKIIKIFSNLKTVGLPIINVHGDFVPYNMQVENNKVFIIDWEFARSGLPLYDLYHFLFQGLYQIKKYKVEKIINIIFKSSKNSKLLKYYLEELKIDTTIMNLLFITYLLESLKFDLEIREQNNLSENHFYKALEYIL